MLFQAFPYFPDNQPEMYSRPVTDNVGYQNEQGFIQDFPFLGGREG